MTWVDAFLYHNIRVTFERKLPKYIPDQNLEFVTALYTDQTYVQDCAWK